MARKIILKEDGLNGSGNAPTGYRYLGYDGTTTSEKAGATVSAIGGSSLPYKAWVALINQVSAGNVTTTVISNDFAYEMTVTSSFTGSVNIVPASNDFLASKTFITSTANNYNIGVYRVGTNNVTVSNYNAAGTPLNGFEAYVEIRVYN